MFRKAVMLAAAALLCLPIGGGASLAVGKCLDALPLPALVEARARWWLGPYQLSIASACLMVLALTLAMRPPPNLPMFPDRKPRVSDRKGAQ